MDCADDCAAHVVCLPAVQMIVGVGGSTVIEYQTRLSWTPRRHRNVLLVPRSRHGEVIYITTQ
jgi:ribose 5-phosphate isomerase